MTDTHERIGDIWMEYKEKSEPLTSDEAQCPPSVIVSILISRMEEEIAIKQGSICALKIIPGWSVKPEKFCEFYHKESRLEATYAAWRAVQEQQQ